MEEIRLLSTILVRWDGIKIYYPNFKLSNEAVMNVTRSANRWESFKVLPYFHLPATCRMCFGITCSQTHGLTNSQSCRRCMKWPTRTRYQMPCCIMH